LGCLGSQLGQGQEGQTPQHTLAAWPQRHHDLPAIATGAMPHDHAPGDESIDELHGAVMADMQTLGERPDRRRAAPLEAFDLKQQEVLLGLDTRRARRRLAGTEDTANLIAPLRQGRVIDTAGPVRVHQNALYRGPI
jgi:hypothetical protein